jgi:hypothetical protein
VVGDNQTQWSASTMGAEGRGWVSSYRVDNVVFYYIGDGGEGGGERTYSYSSAPHSDK